MIGGVRSWLLVALAAGACGCKALQAAAFKSDYIDDQTKHHVYGMSSAQVYAGYD